MKKNLVFTVIIAAILSGCSIRTSPSLFESNIEKETLLKVANNYEELIDIYKKKIEQNNYPSDILKLCELYYDIKDYNSAMYFLEPLLERSVTDKAMLLKAKILEAKGEYQSALDSVNETLNLNPRMAEAWNVKGVIFASNGYIEEAQKSFFIAKDLFYDDCIVNTNLGALEILKSNYNAGIGYFEPLYVRGCKNSYLLHNYTFALIKNKEYARAQKVMEDEGMSKFPRKLITALRNAVPNDFSQKDVTN